MIIIKLKEVCYLICQMYQAMKKNYSEDERYKKSNAGEFFAYVITLFNFAKNDFILNSPLKR